MLAALAAAVLIQAAPAVDPCDHDRNALLALSPKDFDQDLEGGWRPLGNRDECREVAADLLAAYRERRWGDLDVEELHSNYWHEGQLRAALEQKARAVRLLLAGVSPSPIPDGRADYAVGTVAFLLNDLPTLQAARARLAATPQPPGFQESSRVFKERYGRELTWPLNLDVLDGLIACFGKPYSEAYGQDCRPST